MFELSFLAFCGPHCVFRIQTDNQILKIPIEKSRVQLVGLYDILAVGEFCLILNKFFVVLVFNQSRSLAY